jgi:Glycosyltransferase family 87
LGFEVAGVAFLATHANPVLVPAARQSNPGWLSGILPQVGAITRADVGLLVLGMVVAYGVVVAASDTIPSTWIRRAAYAAVVLAVLAPPILSADLFGYLAWARMGVRGLNPYSHATVDIGHDPVAPFLRSHHGDTPYGPLFTLVSYVLAPLGVPAGMWALKALAGTAALAAMEMLRRVAVAQGHSPVRAMAVFALNPLLLVWGIGGAHNDLLVAVVVAAGILMTVRGGAAPGVVAFVAATALKFSAAVALPYVMLGPGRQRSTLIVLAAAVAAAAIVTLIAFGPAFLHIDHILGAQQSMVATHSGPAEVARLLGHPGTTGPERLIGAILVGGTVLVLAVAVGRDRIDWLAATGWTYLVLLLTTAWLLPWYVIWVLPFAAAASERRLTAAVVVLTALIAASQLAV